MALECQSFHFQPPSSLGCPSATDRQGCRWSQICKCCRRPREIRRTNGSMWMPRSKSLQFLGRRNCLGPRVKVLLGNMLEQAAIHSSKRPKILQQSSRLVDTHTHTPHCLLFFSARFQSWIHSNWSSELSQTFSD